MKRTAVVLLAAALVPPAVGQEPAGSLRRQVDVVVRSVLVTATDAKGNPVTTAPSPADLEVTEDGKPMEVVGIDAVLGDTALSVATPAERAAPPTAVARRTKQVLYLDTVFLRQNSVKEVATTFSKELPKLLAIGPLEIVVADPSPRVWFASSGSDSALRDALTALWTKVPGRDRLLAHRRETQSVVERDPRTTHEVGRSSGASAGRIPSLRGSSSQAFVQMQALHESSLLRDAMTRLGRWASALPTTEGGIVYLASDGFEINLRAFYGDPGDATDKATSTAQDAFGSVLQSFRRATESLQAGGWTAVPVALNATPGASSTSNAEFTGRERFHSTTSTASGGFLVNHPLDPLHEYADATGGEVLVSSDQLALAAGRLASRWVVSWQADKVLDGRLHHITVRSRRHDLVVRATKAFPSGTPEATSAARAMDAMEGSRANGGLPLEVSLSKPGLSSKRDRLGADLTVKATLEDLKPVLAKTGAPHMRVTVAVEIPSSLPFVWHVEKTVPKDFGKGWIYEAPIEWPKGARTVAVVVEELSTGSWASSTGRLPLAP